jgi:hypothetical protein
MEAGNTADGGGSSKSCSITACKVQMRSWMRDAMEDSAAIDEEDNGKNDGTHSLRSVYRRVRGLGYIIGQSHIV